MFGLSQDRAFLELKLSAGISIMSRMSFFPAILAASVAFIGCTSEPTKQDAGMVIGGALGGLLGSTVDGSARTTAIIAGTILGAFIGVSIGKSMDDTDRLKTAQSLETVRTGTTTSWQNPDTGHQYAVTPTRTFEDASGPCREYTMEALIGGQKEEVYGTACRQPDGSWKIQD